MTRSEIRLKCIELCYRKDEEATAILERAKVLEKWVSESENEHVSEKAPVKRGRPAKADTAGILD